MLKHKIEMLQHILDYTTTPRELTMSSNQIITEPSICIPRTLNNVTWRDVKDIMEELFGKGTIERVDLVQDKRDEQFCRIFIHMRYWPMSDPRIVAMRENLLAGREVKVVHNQPWFWKCLASNCPRPENKRSAITPYLIMEESPRVPEVVRQNGFSDVEDAVKEEDAVKQTPYRPSKRAVAKKASDRDLKNL